MRKNNFDIVRLLLAIIVVLVHSYDLSESSALAPLRHLLSARMGVECFFVISGFLIFASYERCSSLVEYGANRAWRILPAYWFSTCLCLAIAFCHGRFDVGRFLVANLTFANFLHPSIDGVFATNPLTFMNGALWTIKIEVMFYVAVPMIVWLCRRLRRDVVLWTFLLGSLVFHWAATRHESLVVQLPGQLSFFMVGTLIYYHLDFFKRHGGGMVAGAVLLYGLHVWTGWFALRPFAIGVLVLAACLLLPQVKGPTRWGDFSYGTYIIHWPIIQVLVESGWFGKAPWLTLLLTLLLVAVGAVCSWNLIEKPSLAHAKSRRMRRSAEGLAPNYPPAVP